MAARNEIEINSDETGLLLWKMFDAILVSFWKGYFKYIKEIGIKAHGTKLIPMFKVFSNWLDSNTELYNFLRNGAGMMVLRREGCDWRGGKKSEMDLLVPFKFAVPAKCLTPIIVPLPVGVLGLELPPEIVGIPAEVVAPDQVAEINAGGRPRIWDRYGDLATDSIRRDKDNQKAAKEGLIAVPDNEGSNTCLMARPSRSARLRPGIPFSFI
jgi:hypothetical protein